MGHRDGVPASTIPLLQTKLFPPGAGGLPLLPRQALIDRLYEARGRRAMVLSAPAGFGKSTILCQLRLRLLEQGAAVAWLSCDETDSEPQRLIQYLLASIQRVVPAFGGNTANLLGTDVAVPLEGILDAFLADLRRLEGLVPVPRRFPPHPPRRLAAWGSLPDREPARSRAGGGLDPLPPALPGRRTDPQALDLLPERGRPATFARGERCVSPRPQGAGAGRARAEAAVQAHRRLDHGVAPGGPGPQSQYRPGRFPPRALRDRTEHRRLPGGRRAGQPARRPAAVPRPDLGAR